MKNRIGVALCVGFLASAGVLVGCGDDKSDGNESSKDAGGGNNGVDIPEGDGGACDPKKLPKPPENGINYPDSYCGEGGCVADACDPLGRCEPACNAWALKGKMSFQAVVAKDDGTPGAAPAPTGKSGEDVCPANMVTPKGADINCCQRTDNSGVAKPALKLTSLALSRPAYFAIQAVAGVNKMAIEGDLYNWVTVLSSGMDGELTATSGNAFPNKDGSFSSVKGALNSGGETFNADGVWDAETGIPGMLATSGTMRTLTVGPTSPTRDYVMVMWLDNKYDFARLELHMRGLKWEMPVDKDLNCAGERVPGSFVQVGELNGFVPLEAAIKSEVWLSREGSQNLCTSMSGAKDCKVPVAKWVPAS